MANSNLEQYLEAILAAIDSGEELSIPRPSWNYEKYLAAIVQALRDHDPADPEVIEEFVNAWLDDHPEATTTVEDDSITRAKLKDAALVDIAGEYSSSSTYAVGDYVFHSGALYRCISAITTAEAWTAAHWTQVALADDVADLKSIVGTKLPYNSKEAESAITTETALTFPNVGAISSSSGQFLPSETAYRTSDYIPLNNVTGIYRTGTNTKFTLWAYAFYDSDKELLGHKSDTTDYTIESYNGKQVTWLDLDDYPTAEYIRITIDPNRPYTYYKVENVETYKYNIPHVVINGVELLKFYGKKIVNFGDSLFGNYRDTNDTTDKSISKMIADATGATVYNCGFGGCRMSYHSQYWRAFSMYALADAITTDTWTEQDAAIAAAPSGMPSYFADTLALLKTIDFDNVDYITIGYGTNDYTGDIFIDYRSGLEEYQYFKGALEYSVRKILTAFPHIRIVVITPCWRWFLENGEYAYSSDDEQSKNTRNLMLTDYVTACKTVCDNLHIPCIDTYTNLGFNQYDYLEYFPANDGTHMNQAGRQLRADRIIGQMESLY